MKRSVTTVLALLLTTSAAADVAQLISAAPMFLLSPQGRGAIPAAPPLTCAEPYEWYQALCLEDIPFHSSSGTFGPQDPVDAPAAPVTTGTSNVSSNAGFQSAIALGARRINITDNVASLSYNGNIQDIDIVVQLGVRVGSITLGCHPSCTADRVRIRGETIGAYSGGSVGWVFLLGVWRDVIVDGFGISGDTPAHGPSFYPANDTDRLAVMNMCAYTSQSFAYSGGDNSVWINNNVVNNYSTSADTGNRWGVRGVSAGGKFIVYHGRWENGGENNDEASFRVRVSPRPSSAQLYFWLKNVTVIDSAEMRGVSVFRVEGNAPGEQLTAAWAIDSTGYLRALTTDVQAWSLQSWYLQTVDNYARATGNTFYGDLTSADHTSNEGSTEAADADFLTGNTYSAWQSPPAWSSPLYGTNTCDPTSLPTG